MRIFNAIMGLINGLIILSALSLLVYTASLHKQESFWEGAQVGCDIWNDVTGRVDEDSHEKCIEKVLELRSRNR